MKRWSAVVALLIAMAAPASACPTLPTVYFGPNSSVVDELGAVTLEGVAITFRYRPGHLVQVVGHSDGVGLPASRRRIALARARVARDALVRLGVPRSRILIRGASDAEPLARPVTAEPQPANRRAEILLVTASQLEESGGPFVRYSNQCPT